MTHSTSRWAPPLRAWLVALSSAWVLAVSNAIADEFPPHAIAIVEKLPLSIERFATAMKETGVGFSSLGIEDRGRLKREILAEVIEQELLLREARGRGLVVSDTELEREIARTRAETGGEELAAILEERGLTPVEWERRLRENLVVAKLLAVLSRGVPEPTDGELRAYYTAHPEEFVEPEAVEARQILVATEAEAAALRVRLLGGASFSQLAAEHSKAPEASDGGRLGFIRQGQVPEAFDVLFTLKPGEVSPVVHTAYGYHLFTVSARRAATHLTYQDVAAALRERLGRTRREDAVAEWIRERVARADVVINEPLLAQFDGQQP